MPRYSGTLISMLLFLLLHPICLELELGGTVVAAMMTALLLALVASVALRKGELWVALGLVLIGEFSRWVAVYDAHPNFDVFARVFNVLFFGYLVFLLLRALLGSKVVTLDTVAGALCIYLLAGFLWASIYSLIEHFDPGSFEGVTDMPNAVLEFHNYLYFSLVTLTTLGFGDLVPLKPIAKSFSAVEALTGQIFLGVFVARMIGSTLVESMDAPD